jgi:hypothetical protein
MAMMLWSSQGVTLSTNVLSLLQEGATRMKDTPSGQKEVTTAERPWPPAQGEWTYDDWLKLPDDGYRYEVIDGVLYVSPPPLIRHQRSSIRLETCFMDFLKVHP